MRLGFFSPLPPARTGVADYSAALLRALRAHGEVAVADPSADVCLYHLGNNSLHRAIYQPALARPGVIVLHDAVLHHFFLGAMRENEYVDEFAYNYGAWSKDLARHLWRERARSGMDPRYFRYPMLRRIVERSQAVIVHNPGAAAAVRGHSGDAPVFEIPHLFEPVTVPSQLDASLLRERLGVAPEEVLFGVFGHLRESKRLLTILRAFAKVRLEAPARLLAAGEFASSDLERAARPLLAQDGVISTGYLADRDFWNYASAVDACLNLRYPSAGETSGIAIRLMGIGKPVFLTAGLETSQFPGEACISIEHSPEEEELLAAYMIWLARNREAAAQIGRRAREHVLEHHDVRKCAAEYWRVVADCYHKSNR